MFRSVFLGLARFRHVPNPARTMATTAAPSTINFNVARLQTKSIISIAGNDSAEFLQGLITNDVRHLVPTDTSTAVTVPCIYSFLLNNTGRVVADLFVYRFPDRDDLLLEVDARIRKPLTELLRTYKIRRKVEITQLNNHQCVVLFPDLMERHQKSDTMMQSNSETILTADPRNWLFGYKALLTSPDAKIEQWLPEGTTVTEVDEYRYRSFRYHYGIGEGCVDFPPEASMPLEVNGDVLNAISFHKGCYVGQELTTRAYHTGVVRKRLMPIRIISQNPLRESLPMQNVIDAENHRTLGRFRANHGEQGIAILKYGEIDPEQTKLKLSSSEFPIKTWRPFWWQGTAIPDKPEA